MQTTNSFSFTRFFKLIKLSLLINKKLILISLAAVVGTLFLGLILLQSMVNFEYWGQGEYMATFLFVFLIMGFIYTSQSFPAFRSKTKSLSFLMLPASNSEKYVFELLTRIVAFIILLPAIYWVVSNLEGRIVHHYVPQLASDRFSFVETISKSIKTQKGLFWGIFGTIQAILFVFTAAFAGASHFYKSPLIRTLFTFSLIVAGYFLFSYLLFRGLNLKVYHPTVPFAFFTKNRILIFFAFAGLLVNVTLLAIAWFRLKEKEA
jgi:hypothetical protein